jgi:hypothetical protein
LGAVTTLGDVLDLANGARDRLTSLRATVWHWGHTERAERAMRRFIATRGRGGIRLSLGDGPPPETNEHVAHLWVDGRSKSRLERPWPPGSQARALTVIDGGRRWSSFPGERAVEGWVGGEHDASEYEWMLDPPPLLESLEPRIAGEDDVDGRAAFLLRGPPRQISRFIGPGLSPGADQHEVAIDAELGIVLRRTARIDGQPFAIVELRDVAVGIELPPATFVFEPPDGQEIIRIPPPGPTTSSRNWVTIEEVAAGVPFLLFAPRDVPSVGARASLIGGDWPTPTPTVAYLFYDLPPALDLVERAVADAGPAEGWESVDVGGLTAMVRRRARHPAGRHEVRVEREGTEVRLSSDLELERLLEIAATLERVRPADQP